MIIPTAVTKYDRCTLELLEFAIFCVCVAGKNSDQTAKKVDALWNDADFFAGLWGQVLLRPSNDACHELYVDFIKQKLQKHKVGQYQRLSRVIFWLNQQRFNLNHVRFNELVDIKGIGPKTAAFFILHTRRDAVVPVIDTHICKYMAEKDFDMRVTSSLPKYLENARLVVSAIKHDFPHMTLAEADLTIWKKYSGRS